MTGIRDQGSGIGRGRLALSVLSAVLLAACGGSLPPPDWKLNTQSGLESFTKHYLDGNAKLADLNFAKARNEASRTGRPDLIARLELARCGVRAAALEFDACTAFEDLRASAGTAEEAYAGFLAGAWQSLDAGHLPPQYGGVLKADADAARTETLAGIKDPVSRLIAAGVLFRMGQLPPAGIVAAVETASAQGWRRPLLAWLGIQLKRAEAAGDSQAAAAIRQRMDLVAASSAPAKAAP